jgi:hypothetical protein
MIDINQVWQRVSQLPQFQGQKLGDYIYQGFVARFALAAAQISQNQPVRFPAGAILYSIAAAAGPIAQAATAVARPGLDLFSVSIAYEIGRSIVGTDSAIGSSVFSTGAESAFPAKEIVIPTNGALIYNVTNLTTTPIEVTITHHALVRGAIA